MINSTAQRMDYPKQEMDQLLKYLVRDNYWFLTTQELYDFLLLDRRQFRENTWDKNQLCSLLMMVIKPPTAISCQLCKG
ncbi:MAG TPA: hypothetical protein V6D10_08230 [Trichocoleus sp.]|jgi:hypothetical protein